MIPIQKLDKALHPAVLPKDSFVSEHSAMPEDPSILNALSAPENHSGRFYILTQLFLCLNFRTILYRGTAGNTTKPSEQKQRSDLSTLTDRPGMKKKKYGYYDRYGKYGEYFGYGEIHGYGYGYCT